MFLYVFGKENTEMGFYSNAVQFYLVCLEINYKYQQTLI